jgi:hypothetical protein
LQRLQNGVVCAIGNFSRRTSVRDMHEAFQIPYVFYYITKLCRQQAEVSQNHENENVRYIGQGEARHRKYKRLKLGITDPSSRQRGRYEITNPQLSKENLKENEKLVAGPR